MLSLSIMDLALTPFHVLVSIFVCLCISVSRFSVTVTVAVAVHVMKISKLVILQQHLAQLEDHL